MRLCSCYYEKQYANSSKLLTITIFVRKNVYLAAYVLLRNYLSFENVSCLQSSELME